MVLMAILRLEHIATVVEFFVFELASCAKPKNKMSTEGPDTRESNVLGGVYTTTLRTNTETFVFVYIEEMRRLHQYVFTKNSARYCNY